MSARVQPTKLHCYHPRRGESDCNATLARKLRDSVRELQRQSMQTVDRIERKYAGRMRVAQQRVWREVERETVEEIRAAIEGMTL